MTLSIHESPPVQKSPAVHKTTAISKSTTTHMDIHDLTIPGGPIGKTWLCLIRPVAAARPLPVVVYIQGDDQESGADRTRRAAANIAMKQRAAVVVVDYSLSPRARFPIAIEETYTAVAWIAEHGSEHGLDGARIMIAADDAGAKMADELMLLLDERGGAAVRQGGEETKTCGY
jgi:acetyl esterase